MNSSASGRTKNSSITLWGSALLLVGLSLLAASQLEAIPALGVSIAFAASLLIATRRLDLLNLSRITLSSFWYLTYLAMIFVPSFFVYTNNPGPARSSFIFGVTSVLITCPIGWWLADVIFDHKKQETEIFYRAPISTCDLDKKPHRRFIGLLVLAIFLTAAYVSELRTIPLFYMMKNPGDYLELTILREESFKLLTSPLVYLYAMNRALLYPFLIAASAGFALTTRKGSWRFLFALSAGMGLFFSSLSIAKAPVANIVLILGFLGYLFKSGKLGLRFVSVLLIALLTFPVLIVVSVSSGNSVSVMVALGAIAERLFYMPAEVVYYYFEVFPAHVHFLHGLTIDKLAFLLGQPTYDVANVVGQYAYPQYQDTVSANGAFFASLYADFGMWGVLLGSVIAGFIMQAVHIHLIRRPKDPVTLACYAFALPTIWYLHSIPLPIVLASNGLVLALLLRWFLQPGDGFPPAFEATNCAGALS